MGPFLAIWVHESSMLLTTATSPFQSLAPRLLHGGGDLPLRIRRADRLVMNASTEAKNPAVMDAVFEPFEEVKKELLLVPTVPHASIARHVYSDLCEDAINDQIKYILIFLPFFIPVLFFYVLCIYL